MRYPPLSQSDMNCEQKRAVKIVTQRRKPSVSSEGGVEGPFVPLVYVPGILDRLQALGEHCRFHSRVPARLREFAIIITARHVKAPLEFHVHAMEAREFKLPDTVIDAVAARQRPENMQEDEEIVYNFCTAFHAEGRVSNEVFSQTEKAFGRPAIIDLMAICGYYAMLGLSMNVSHPPVPKFLVGFQPAFSVEEK